MDSSIHKNSTIPEDKEEDYTTMVVNQAVEIANDRDGTQSEKMSEQMDSHQDNVMSG